MTIPSSDTWEIPARALFGSASRFEIAAWISGLAPGSVFTPSDIFRAGHEYKESTLTTSHYRKLADAGMVKRHADHRDRLLWYERLDSPLWEVLVLAAEVFNLARPSARDALRDTLLDLRERLTDPAVS